MASFRRPFSFEHFVKNRLHLYLKNCYDYQSIESPEKLLQRFKDAFPKGEDSVFSFELDMPRTDINKVGGQQDSVCLTFPDVLAMEKFKIFFAKIVVLLGDARLMSLEPHFTAESYPYRFENPYKYGVIDYRNAEGFLRYKGYDVDQLKKGKLAKVRGFGPVGTVAPRWTPVKEYDSDEVWASSNEIMPKKEESKSAGEGLVYVEINGKTRVLRRTDYEDLIRKTASSDSDDESIPPEDTPKLPRRGTRKRKVTTGRGRSDKARSPSPEVPAKRKAENKEKGQSEKKGKKDSTAATPSPELNLAKILKWEHAADCDKGMSGALPPSMYGVCDCAFSLWNTEAESEFVSKHALKNMK